MGTGTISWKRRVAKTEVGLTPSGARASLSGRRVECEASTMHARKPLIIVDSIGAAIRHHYSIVAHCSVCRRMAALDLSALADRLGYSHGTLAADLSPRLRCSACGGRQVGIVIAIDQAKARAARL